jgi:hypothetical protein
MRIAVVSDIHGNMTALSAVVADIGRHAIDATVNLGDSLSGPLLPLETARFLMATPWIHLAGNHERQLPTHGPGRRSASDEYAHGCLAEGELAWMAALKPQLAARLGARAADGLPLTQSPLTPSLPLSGSALSLPSPAARERENR